MKKVINATLGGHVYLFEEDAYTTLSTYLEEVTKTLNNNPDKQEIIMDIETAISEHIKTTMRYQHAVTIQEITVVITRMGNPEAYTAETMQTQEQLQQEPPLSEEKPNKKLYRDPEDKVIAGVSSGLSVYLGIDTTIIRVAFVVATLFWGWGLIVYILLWITMPEAKTVSDRLRMQGRPITVEKIEEYVYSAAQKAKKHAEDIAERVKEKQHNSKQ